MGRTRLAEVASAFLRLGCTSFGGPVAHLGYLRNEFVDRRKWLDDAHFADLVALCQFLPGPASSQVVFALGKQRAGLAGAALASLCFTLPSALIMLALGMGVAAAADVTHSRWIHGLQLAAVPIVAQAVWAMGQKLCPDWPRRWLAGLAALALLAATLWQPAWAPWLQVVVMAGGWLVGWRLYRHNTLPPPAIAQSTDRTGAALALLLCGALLLGWPLLAALDSSQLLTALGGFYRAGALTFGGGHVVLPLLQSELVPRGLVDAPSFMAGYGAAQALPGPLFALAAYLGAILHGGSGWPTGVLCLLALFLPGWLLVGGALPFWQQLRARAAVQAGLLGANAAVVGVLLAALVWPVVPEGVHTASDALLALAALVALERLRWPSWLVVGGVVGGYAVLA